LGHNTSATTYGTSVNSTLGGMEQLMGSDAYKLYLARPDVQHFQSQLAAVLNSTR